MCTNQREIINRYTGHRFYVKCGHCTACLQEKAAHRVSRIKAEDSPLTDTIMCTLTYRRNDCPYVFRQDAYAFAKGEFKDYIYYSNIEEHNLYHIQYLNESFDNYYHDKHSKVNPQHDNVHKVNQGYVPQYSNNIYNP